MKKLLVLSSDTAHHRYFLHRLQDEGIQPATCLFETEHVKAPFPVGPVFDEDEAKFEDQEFFKQVPRELSHSLDAHYVESVNSPNARAKIEAVAPDLGIVFGTGRIDKEVISLFADGLFNVHRGIAQKYRGLDSDLWAIYHKDYDNIGVTIHMVEPLLDTGEIVAQERMPLRPGMKAHQIRYYTSLMATEMVIEGVRAYLGGRLQTQPQEKKGRYYSFMPIDLKKIVSRRFDRYCEKLT